MKAKLKENLQARWKTLHRSKWNFDILALDPVYRTFLQKRADSVMMTVKMSHIIAHCMKIHLTTDKCFQFFFFECENSKLWIGEKPVWLKVIRLATQTLDQGLTVSCSRNWAVLNFILYTQKKVCPLTYF